MKLQPYCAVLVLHIVHICEAKLNLRPQLFVKHVVGFVLGSALFTASEANAGILTSHEQAQVNAVSRFQKPVAELLDQLRPVRVVNSLGTETTATLLTGGPEDSNVVTSYLETYIKPCQKSMETAAPILKLGAETQAEIEVLPLLMKGHVLELTEAIRAEKLDQQAKEVEEVQETLTDFLKLAGTKYDVQLYSKPQTLSDAQLYGPLGCEYWGKHRILGSNKCTE